MSSTPTGMIQMALHNTFGRGTRLGINTSVNVDSPRPAKVEEPSTQTLDATVISIHLFQLQIQVYWYTLIGVHRKDL